MFLRKISAKLIDLDSVRDRSDRCQSLQGLQLPAAGERQQDKPEQITRMCLQS